MARRLALLLLLALWMVLPGAAVAAPSQVHLSQTSDGIVVQWAMLGDTRTMPAGKVDYGPTTLYGSIAEAQMVGYVDATPYIGYSSAGVARDLAEAAATLYRATITGVLPGATFHYRIVDGAGVATGDIVGRALPGPASSLRFVAYADQGTLEDGTLGPPTYRPTEIVNLSALQDAQMFVVAGDLAYAEEGGLRWWNQWFDIIQPIAATRPFYAAPGNHDRDLLVGYDHWYKRFAFAGDEQNYGVDAGPVHFLFLNSNEACLEGEAAQSVQRVNPNCTVTSSSGAPLENTAMTDFMRADLASARARGVPWIVAVFHHPLYADGGYNETNAGSAYMWWMRDHWAPIFEEYGVDLVLTGHDHGYSRSWPMLHNATTTTSGTKFTEGNGILYVVSGGGGQNLYPLTPGTPWWQAKSIREHHIAVVDATATKMKFVVKDHNGVQLDAFELRKAVGGQNAVPLWLVAAALAGVVGSHVARRRMR